MVVETSLTRIARALNWYQTMGFEYVECPWFVETHIMTATCPPERIVSSTLGNLVGSAEQSFLALEFQGALTKGRYVGYTPCFRPDDVDDLHQQCFHKVELYQTDDVSHEALKQLIRTAKAFIEGAVYEAGKDVANVTVERSQDGYDILIKGVEVGSYGIRTYEGKTWVFGTGCAEPRLTKALTFI